MNKGALPLILIAVLFLGTAAAGAAGGGPKISVNVSDDHITAGENVTISGTSNGFKIYLFMTGPGLDPAGVMIFNTTKSARTKGHLWVSPVDNEWSLPWNTGRITGPLQSGNYSVYACVGPFDTEQIKTCDRCNCVLTNVTITVPGASPSPSQMQETPVITGESAVTTPATSAIPPVTGNMPAVPPPQTTAPLSILSAAVAVLSVAGLLIKTSNRRDRE